MTGPRDWQKNSELISGNLCKIPLEELYNLYNCPWKVNNLVKCPKSHEKLLELRGALAQWQLDIGDLGFIPEHDLVQMMWPGLIQPETAPVTFSQSGNRLELANETEGASIAWQAQNIRHYRLR